VSDTETCVSTFQFKIRRNQKFLAKTAPKVNYVFNYCNETSFRAIKRDGKFLSGFDLQKLTSGIAKILKINAQTVQMVCAEYANRRKQFKKRKLKWRKSSGSKRSLGWIPFKASGVRVESDTVTFMNKKIKFFKSRELGGPILTGSFSQDAVGDWYVNFQCEVQLLEAALKIAVGVDLGQKSLVTTSDGEVFHNPKAFYAAQDVLAKAQRHGKKRRAKKIHRKISRIRKDNLHKVSTTLTSNYAKVILGNLRLANSKADLAASFGTLKTFFEYKAIRRRGMCVLVNEAYTTVTCNNCLERTGPTGLSGLSVREWACASCGQTHDRDKNAAKNILRIGLDTPKTFNEPLAS